ncbi:hypothetical protein ACM55H_16215 [Flavobacterium sp. ZT3R17]|uniref:hypothetical protein n=1 Tax=Flavobacterium cryoconiti TaxID=3398736 RepID=UPI003A86E3C1
MKKLILSFVFLMTCTLSLPVFSQIENEPIALGLPGDNLNLYAVLDIFQRSKTLEEFERALNSKDTNINNLDLNNDNFIDYIRVVSYRDGDSYSIVLRVAINNSQYQDVAVIEVNKDRFGKVLIQIIGDEELYGKNYIVEPGSGNTSTPNPGYAGNRRVIVDNYGNDIFYVNDWPIIIHLFSPSFVIYISPWRWGFYPSYWRPWTPVFYYNYWGYHRHYYDDYSYRRVTSVRYPVPYSYYYSRRNSSPIVRSNRNNDTYRRTYEGRTFRRPDVPVLPRTRQAMPRTRQENLPATHPVQPNQQRNERPTAPRTHQENLPETRPVQPNQQRNERSNAPRTRQESLPTTRPVQPNPQRNEQPNVPRTRQENLPATRPVQPNPQRNERPNAPRNHQESPSARPAQPATPTNRQQMPGNRPVHPTVPMNRQPIPGNNNPGHGRERERN